MATRLTDIVKKLTSIESEISSWKSGYNDDDCVVATPTLMEAYKDGASAVETIATAIFNGKKAIEDAATKIRSAAI